MPRGDKKGPEGRGPMTGRRMGYCAGNDMPGIRYGRRMGCGMGYGRHMGHGMGYGRAYQAYNQAVYENIPAYSPYQEPAEERRHLEQCVQQMEGDLENLRKRLQELEPAEE